MINEAILYHFSSHEWGELKRLYFVFKHVIPVVLEQCLNVIIQNNGRIIRSEDELTIVIQFLQFVLQYYSCERINHKELELGIADEAKNTVDSVNLLLDTLLNIYANLERIRAQEEDFSYGHE